MENLILKEEGTSETIRKNLNKINFNSFYNNQNFNDWLVGFYEADGCFSINNRGELHFELYQHSNDVDLLYKIKTFLQCGTVSTRKDRNISVFHVYSIKQFKTILYPIFNNKILSDYKFKQFKKICDLANLPAIKGNHNNNAWLIGFIDGDGSFFTSITEKQISAVFSLGQKNQEILHIINNNYFNNHGKVNGGNINKRIYYILRFSCKSLTWVNKFMLFPLLTRKRISYNKWIKIVEMIEKKEHLSSLGKEKIIEISKTINVFNKNMIESDLLGN